MILLVISFIAWGAVVLYTRKGAWRVLSGNGADHDATKMGFHLVGWLMLAYRGRRALMPADAFSLDILTVLSIAVAVYLCGIVRFYKQ